MEGTKPLWPLSVTVGLVTLLNVATSFIVGANEVGALGVGGVVGYAVTSAVFIPFLFVALAQISKPLRNRRSRLKSFLLGSMFVTGTTIMKFFTIAAESMG